MVDPAQTDQMTIIDDDLLIEITLILQAVRQPAGGSQRRELASNLDLRIIANSFIQKTDHFRYADFRGVIGLGEGFGDYALTGTQE